MLQLIRCNGEEMAWGAGSDPDFRELRQARIHVTSDGIEVPDGGHATDGKAGLSADQGSVRFAERFTSNGAGFGCVHAVATSGKEQDSGTGGFAAKDDGFADLIHMAVLGLGGLLGGVGVHRGFHHFDFQPKFSGGAFDAFQAFAHGMFVA